MFCACFLLSKSERASEREREREKHSDHMHMHINAPFTGLARHGWHVAIAVQCVLHLNLAMCYIKQASWKKALAECDEALAINATSAKGLYRKALVLENMKDFDAALQVVRKGQAAAPEDAAMAKLAKRVHAKRTNAMEKQKKLFSKMF